MTLLRTVPELKLQQEVTPKRVPAPCSPRSNSRVARVTRRIIDVVGVSLWPC